MIKIVTPSEMQSIDRAAIEDFGIPGIVLMENAGLRMVDLMLDVIGENAGDPVCVFCGRGNNGGDGFVIARHLINRGFFVRTWVFTDRPKLSGDALTNYKILSAMEADVSFAPGEADVKKVMRALLKEAMLRPPVLVDALLGTGTRGAVKGTLVRAIQGINQIAELSGSPVFSVDVPSGVNGETGAVDGKAVMADVTVTMGLPKRGLLFSAGRKHAGELHVVDISFPATLLEDESLSVDFVEKEDVALTLPEREIDDHKFNCGKVLIIAGSRGMTGAAVLTSMAALRMGSGLIKVCLPASLNYVIENQATEILSVPVPETAEGTISNEALPALKELSDWADVVAVGPGLSRNSETCDTILSFLAYCKRPMVIDADAVNYLAGKFDVIEAMKPDVVFTPHLKEFSGLIGMDMQKIERNRIEAAIHPAVRLKKTIVLKGAPTITAAPDGRVFVNSSGDPALATPGSGDVLTGIITSLIGQHVNPVEAAWAGVHIHGLAGDRAGDQKTVLGVKASDLIDLLPEVLKALHAED